MYRTGDRGVQRADGQIDFRGRLDRQVKIRGFRIELDEIGAVLQHHRAIEHAIVVTRTSEAGETQLAAYLARKANETPPSASELQQHLLRSLPDYMVPSAFFLLGATPPLTANGKIDFSRLEEASNGQLLDEIELEAPVSQAEMKVLALVRSILQNDDVGPTDNFFLAGGHSLLGTQLLVRLRDEFGVDLTLRQMFEAPTAAGLASLVEERIAPTWLAKLWAELLRKREIQREDNFFAVGGDLELMAVLQRRIAAECGRHISIHRLIANPTVAQQAGLMGGELERQPILPVGVIGLRTEGALENIFWMHYLHIRLSDALGDNQPFLVVRMMAEDFPLLGKAPSLETIAACHRRKIVAAQPLGPYTVGGMCLGAVLAFEVAQQLRSAGNEVSLVLLDPPSPLDLAGDQWGKWTQPGYLLKRAARLGAKLAFQGLIRRILRVAPLPQTRGEENEVELAQNMLTEAVGKYQLRRYEGRVLIALATERPPHHDFLPAWQKVLSDDLDIQYLEGYHDELLNGESAHRVAEAIHAHLIPLATKA
jgi:thioesterase domain-containing protein/aryl carrier-like protein